MPEENNKNAIWIAIISAVAIVAAAAFQSGYFGSGAISPDVTPQSSLSSMSNESVSCLAKIKCEDNAMIRVSTCRETVEASDLSQAREAQLLRDCYRQMSNQIQVCWSTSSAEVKQRLSAQCEVILNNEGVIY